MGLPQSGGRLPPPKQRICPKRGVMILGQVGRAKGEGQELSLGVEGEVPRPLDHDPPGHSSTCEHGGACQVVESPGGSCSLSVPPCFSPHPHCPTGAVSPWRGSSSAHSTPSSQSSQTNPSPAPALGGAP